MFNDSRFFRDVLDAVSPEKSLLERTNHSEEDTERVTIAVIGSQLGDEGKGRVIDNKITKIVHQHKEFYVIRSQGGSNAGHTVQIGDKKIGLHQIPSAIFHDNAKLILDFGMVIHPEDLLVEIEMAEVISSSLKGRLFLSEDAILCTDVERAKEVLNRVINGNAKGGTSRGISPSTSGRYEKLGLTIKDLIDENWEERLKQHYDHFNKLFNSYGESLESYDVPDFRSTKESGKAVNRKVGSSGEFILRLKEVRSGLIDRGIVADTFLMHQKIVKEKTPLLFEMAQGVGLSPAFGTRPDTTSTETSALGLQLGTRVYRASDISERIGVMKATYMSSVGARVMPTNAVDEWADWVREYAHEYGTTTGRPRDICHIDLPFLSYNVHIGEINQLAMTHLDVSRKTDKVKVCIGYLRDGNEVFYKPDLKYLEGLEPIYVELDGWDHEECIHAKTFDQLPEAARKYVHFIESAVGVQVSIITTGPDRDAIIER